MIIVTYISIFLAFDWCLVSSIGPGWMVFHLFPHNLFALFLLSSPTFCFCQN
jgi:hypothetical protein